MIKAFAIGVTVLIGLAACLCSAATLWEFKFDDTGTTAANTGTAGATTNALQMKKHNYGGASDLHGASGSGVSGLPGDKALDLSGLNYAGGYFDDGSVQLPYLGVPIANCANIQNLQAVTLSGWFSTLQAITNGTYKRTPTLMDFTGASKGFAVRLSTTDPAKNMMEVLLDSSDLFFDISSVMGFSDTNKWFFWALTYNGTLTNNNIKLYMGTKTSAVVQVGATQTANQGSVDAATGDFALDTANGSYTIKGFQDDVRIDNTILAQGDLEVRRKQDANIITTPAVDNANGAAPVLTTSATLNGTLTDGTKANVYIYWWQDGSATTNAIDFGAPLLQGPFATNLVGLTVSTKYWYRCFASNSVNTAWAGTPTNFTTASALRPVVANAATGATNVVNTSAWLNGTLTSTGTAPASVWVFWDTADRGTNKTWTYNHPFDAQSVGDLTWQATSLAPNTRYWYTYYASNTVGDVWATTSMPFKTWGPPGVDNASGASPVGQTTATLNGTLTDGVGAHVYIVYGTDPNDSAFTDDVGTVPEGAFAAAVSGLTPGTTYWYRCYATNAYGSSLAGVATSFNTTPAYTYNDKQTGYWNAANTWSSGNGGTNYPQGADVAVIDSNVVTQNLANASGVIYVNANGVLRNVAYANAVQATLHLNGGVFGLDGAWRPLVPADVFVDADSTITNSDATINVDMNPITLRGASRLALYKPIGKTMLFWLSSGSTFNGVFQVGAGTTVELMNTNGAPLTEIPPAAGSAAIDLCGANAQIGTNNASLQMGLFNDLRYQARITGNGRVMSAYHGNGSKWCTFTNGAVIAPGKAGTNEAGTVWLGFDRVVFAANSEYQCDVAGTNSADLLDCANGFTAVTPVEIDPGAKLAVKFWTPTQAVTNLVVDILRTTSFVTGTNLFTTTFQNTDRWSGVAVNYDTNSVPKRIYVTAASYTPPPSPGTVLVIQ